MQSDAYWNGTKTEFLSEKLPDGLLIRPVAPHIASIGLFATAARTEADIKQPDNRLSNRLPDHAYFSAPASHEKGRAVSFTKPHGAHPSLCADVYRSDVEPVRPGGRRHELYRLVIG